MVQVGVGNEIDLELGGKTDMPTIGRVGEPLAVRGTVRALTDGQFTVTVPMGKGTQMDMGPTAVLDTGRVKIIVISRNVEPWDPGCFRSVGIEPTQMRYLIMKSRIHYRAGFHDISTRDIPCDGVGVTSSDNSLFDFENVRRPIYPLDPNTTATPEYGASPSSG